LLTAYRNALDTGSIDATSSVSQVIVAVQAELNKLKDTNVQVYEEIEAAGIDAMTSIYESMAESSANAAKAEIERWQNTF